MNITKKDAGTHVLGGLVAQGKVKTNSLMIGDGSRLTNILTGTVAVDPGSINTVTRGEIDVTISGVKVGDVVVMNPPSNLEPSLLYVGCRVKAENTVTVFLHNHSGDAVNGSERAWSYLVTSVAEQD